MFPAARIGDPVTHDNLVPSGVIAPPLQGRPMTVLIEGLPAAVVGDFVTCTGALVAGIAHLPQVGPPPAIPPSMPIIKGSFTVLICGMPAARWIVDLSACGVFLGDPKLLDKRKVFIGEVGAGGAGATVSDSLPEKLKTITEAMTSAAQRGTPLIDRSRDCPCGEI